MNARMFEALWSAAGCRASGNVRDHGSDGAPAPWGTCPSEKCSPECPSFDLCRKRILIVGGPGRMEDAYRRFIEARRGLRIP